MDHTNGIREALNADETILGARTTTYSPVLIEVYADIDLDFVWIDLEHGGPSPYDSGQLSQFVRTADAAGIELLVRIPSGRPSLVRKVLDAGVRTLLVPRVETAKEVRCAVKAARFGYDGSAGNRGAAAGRPNAWGRLDDTYPSREDDQTLIGVMIENRTAIKNLDDILTVPELGFVFIGPADLSISFREPFRLDHPNVADAVEAVRYAAQDADVPIGCIANDIPDAERALERGYSLLRIGGEVAAARQVLSERLRALDSGNHP